MSDRRQRHAAFALFTAAALAAPALAADQYWDATAGLGVGGSGNWATTSWNSSSTGAVASLGNWTNGNVAIFDGTAGTVTVASTGLTVSGMTFNVGGYTVSSSAPANVLTLAASTLINTGANSATIEAVLGGSTNLTKSGSGTLTLAGGSANTMTSTFTVADGAVSLKKTAGAALSMATINVGDGTGSAGSAILRNDGSTEQILDTATVNVKADGVYDYNGISETITGAAGTLSLVKGALVRNTANATGTLWLSSASATATQGALTFIGGGSVSTGAGTLRLSGNGGGITYANSGTPANDEMAIVAGIIDGRNSGNAALNHTFNVADNANLAVELQIAAAMSGIATLGKAGAGTLELKGGGTFSANLNVNAGGGTLRLSAGTYAISGGTMAAGGTEVVAGATVNASGSYVLGAAGTPGGSLSISSGTLAFSSLTAAVITSNGGTVNLAGGQLTSASNSASAIRLLTDTGTGSKLNVFGSGGSAPLLSLTRGTIQMTDSAASALTGATLEVDGFAATLNSGAVGINEFNITGNGAASSTPHVLIGSGGALAGTLSMVGGGSLVRVSNAGYLQMGGRDLLGAPSVTASDLSIAGASASATNTFVSAFIAEGANTRVDTILRLTVGGGVSGNVVKPGVMRILNGAVMDHTGPMIIASGSDSRGSVLIKDATLNSRPQPSGMTFAGQNYVRLGGLNSGTNNNAQMIISGASGVWNSFLDGGVSGSTNWSDPAPTQLKLGASLSIGEPTTPGTGSNVDGLMWVNDGATANTNNVANFISVGNTNISTSSGTLRVSNLGTWNHLGGANTRAEWGGHVLIGPQGQMLLQSGGRFLASGSNNFFVSAGVASGGLVTIDGTSAAVRSTLQTPALFLESSYREWADFFAGTAHVVAGTVGPQLVVSNGGLLNLTSTTTDSVVSNLATVTLSNGGEIAMASGRTLQMAGSLNGSGVVTGNLTSTGAINPGNTVGKLTVNGNLSLAGGSLSADLAKLGAGVPVAGSDYDQLDVTGTVGLAGTALTISTGSGLQSGDLFFIVLNDGVDTVSGTFSGLAQDATLTTELGFQFQITYVGDAATNSFTGGNDVALLATAVPEPATVGWLIGASALAMRRRRRAK